jgi:hypothetical protein
LQAQIRNPGETGMPRRLASRGNQDCFDDRGAPFAAAAGWYFTGIDASRAFVASEVRGSWRRAQQVSFASIRHAGSVSGADRLSCASAGNCCAAGSYIDRTGHERSFIVTEKGGTWQRAQEAF